MTSMSDKNSMLTYQVHTEMGQDGSRGEAWQKKWRDHA